MFRFAQHDSVIMRRVVSQGKALGLRWGDEHGSLLLPLQTKTFALRTVAASVFNQSNSFFPDDRCEMT
jgi:hypothetical protein